MVTSPNEKQILEWGTPNKQKHKKMIGFMWRGVKTNYRAGTTPPFLEFLDPPRTVTLILVTTIHFDMIWRIFLPFEVLSVFLSVDFFVSLEKFSIIWRRHQYRWRTVNLDPSSALMAIPRAHCDTCGHSLLYIIWSVVGLSLHVLTTKSYVTVVLSLKPPDTPPSPAWPNNTQYSAGYWY